MVYVGALCPLVFLKIALARKCFQSDDAEHLGDTAAV